MRFYKSAALTANQVTANLVSGISEIEWIRRPSRLRALGSESLTTGGALVKLVIGGRLVLDDVALGGANRSPVFPDDILGEWGAPAGAQVLLIVRESLGGTPTYFIQLDVDPVA
jgi:hypothetical protein